MKGQEIFRKKSLERLSSPEEIDAYLRVISPQVWTALFAVALAIAGLFLWSSYAAVESYILGEAVVSEGQMVIHFKGKDAEDIGVGMRVLAGENSSEISSIGEDKRGKPIAVSNAALPDGSYKVRVVRSSTRIIRFLWN